MLKWLIEKVVLRSFKEISLSRLEERLADETIETKYVPAVRTSLVYSGVLLPSLFLLDTGIVVSVLIPATMVAGTAWFSVSLASMKKKFESFGNELTRDLFVAFTLALCMLLLATAVSLTKEHWEHSLSSFRSVKWVSLLSAILGIIVVGRLLYAIFVGSLKYDINDAMLTGQNEAAERYFKKSLSVLHLTSDALRSSRSLQVANYSIGVAFYEVFTKIRQMYGDGAPPQINTLIEMANNLVTNPAMEKEQADTHALELAEQFTKLCTNTSRELLKHKSYVAITDEIKCLKANHDEEQDMVDMRMSVVFEEMASLMEDFGESLFEPQVFEVQ